MADFGFGLTGIDCNGESQFWPDWNGGSRFWLDRNEIAWNGGSWFWPDWNRFKWRKSILTRLECKKLGLA
jgi:hypothetical protein